MVKYPYPRWCLDTAIASKPVDRETPPRSARLRSSALLGLELLKNWSASILQRVSLEGLVEPQGQVSVYLASERRVLMHLWISSVMRDWFQRVQVGAPQILRESRRAEAQSRILRLKGFGGAINDFAVVGVGPGTGEAWAFL